MKKLQVLVACGVVALLGSTVAHSAEKTFSIGADIELDLTAQDGDLGESGRVKFNATGMSKNDNGYFVKGVGQFALGLDEQDGNVGYEDVYFQAGRDSLNFQVGRFEAVSGFNKGKDTLVVHAGNVHTYEANKARGRFSAGDAVHVAINGGTGATTYQLGLVKSSDDTIEGYRPAVTFSLGRASVTAVYDVIDTGDYDWEGFGLTGSVPLGGGSLGASYADGTGTVLSLSDDHDYAIGEDLGAQSGSLHYTRGSWGVGYIHSKNDNGTAENTSVNTLHAAYTMPLFHVKDASVTFAASASKADEVAGVDDSASAARVRFNYTF